MLAIMAARRHPTSLMALPVEVQIEITNHLAATSERPMDNLCYLWVTCSSMHSIYNDPVVGQCVAMDRCRHGVRSLNDLVNYFALLARLTQVNNLEACLLTRIQTIAPSHALTISPAPPMASTKWRLIWSPYSFIGTMVMPATTTL
jgi:hypothetical protein